MTIKICFLICGQQRTIDVVIENIEKIFDKSKYSCNYIITTSKYNEKHFNNNMDLNTLIKNKNIQSFICTEDGPDTSFKNCINYTKKIKICINNLDDNNDYDIYIIIRSDFIFINDNFISEILNSVDNDYLYVSNNNNNNNNQINEYILISKNYNILKKLCGLFDYCKENNNYCNINLYNFINIKPNILLKKINIDYKIILTMCNIIAISGDSASGKTSLSKYLSIIYSNSNVLHFETDRYHKWERNDENYKTITHLNPNANYLELMNEDVFNLKIGNDIYQVDYNHNTGKFTEKQKIISRQNIILCGLHTLYGETNNIIDIKIFMDTDIELIKKWKIKRDVNERGHNVNKILEQINQRVDDFNNYILCQKKNADIIINFFELDSELKCNFITNKPAIFDVLHKYFIKYNYKYTLKNFEYIIELKNEYNSIYTNEKINHIYDTNMIEHDYYNEIIIFIILYSKYKNN